MKRILWVTVIGIAGVVMLMLASIVLQQRAVRPAGDLRTPVALLADGLKKWDFETVQAATDDSAILHDRYQKWYDADHSGVPAQQRIFRGILSSLEVFPSIRFPLVKPDRVGVQYEVRDGLSRTYVPIEFAPTKEGGWIVKSARPGVLSDDNASLAPILFTEGDNILVAPAVHRLFDALMTGRPEDFAAAFRGGDNATVARTLIDDLREQVVPCRADRLEQMLPVVGKMPKGWLFLRVQVLAKVDGRPMFLEVGLAPSAGGVIVNAFRCRALSERGAGLLPAPEMVPPMPEGKK